MPNTLETPRLHADEQQYLALLSELKSEGEYKLDRTGVGCHSLFGKSLTFNLENQVLPVLTSKKVHLPAVIHELLWFFTGEDHIRYLKRKGVSIWDEWAGEDGNIGPMYGTQWMRPTPQEHPYKGLSQLEAVIENIKLDPGSRRHLVDTWSVLELGEMALNPCHFAFQFYCSPEGALDCQVYQRSADIFLGVPFNITSYALLTHMVAQLTHRTPRRLIMSLGDVHLYDNHREAASIQLDRATQLRDFPTIELAKRFSVKDYQYEDISIVGYDPLPAIKGAIAV